MEYSWNFCISYLGIKGERCASPAEVTVFGADNNTGDMIGLAIVVVIDK